MESKDAATLRIRKLRKKLRQIEHLEGLDRDLTDEELSKCIKKDPIREELQELLSEHGNASTVSSTLSAVNSSGVSWSNVSADSLQSPTPRIDDEIQTPVSQFEEPEPVDGEETYEADQNEQLEDQQGETWHKVTSKHHKHEEDTYNSTAQGQAFPSKYHKNEENTNNSSDAGLGVGDEKGIGTQSTDSSKSQVIQRNPTSDGDKTVFKAPLPSPPKKSKKSSKDNVSVESSVFKQWRSSGFLVTALESHNDIVTAVDCDDSLIISASRDTTVKVWDEASLTELRSLGGHTGSVTDVILLSSKQYGSLGEKLGIGDDKLILSASTDCSIKVWSANTGELLKSIYTYNPVTKVAFHEGLSLVVSTSDGGKLELWDLVSKETVCSVLAHDNAITALCHDSQRIYTASADGEIKIHEIREQSLNCVYVSENVRSLTGQAVSLRGVKSLAVKGDNLFCGDDGVNIKILDWKKGVVKKLANHKEDYGMTDSLCCLGDTLYSSAYDLDIGQGYINVMDVSMSAPSYITSIDDDDTGRIFDIACCQQGARAVTIVTAGLELKVWKQVPAASDVETVVVTKVIPRLCQFATDSDIESDAEFTDSESEHGPGQNRGGKNSVHQASGWRNWCSLL